MEAMVQASVAFALGIVMGVSLSKASPLKAASRAKPLKPPRGGSGISPSVPAASVASPVVSEEPMGVLARARPVLVEALQWFPDPSLGSFVDGKYANKRIGHDKHGVEYTICHVGWRDESSFSHLEPGDWIVGCKLVLDDAVFRACYELQKQEAPPPC